VSIRFLSDAEARAWCSKVGLNPDKVELLPPICFGTPSDAGRRVALARHIWLSLLPPSGEIVVWTRDRHVFESCEHTPMVNRWMEAFGDRRGIDDAPAMLATAESTDDGLSFVVFAMLFFWDCWVVHSDREFVMFSHDEWGAVGPGCSHLLDGIRKAYSDDPER